MPGLDDVVICEPVRTPVGKFGGALSGLAPHTLATALMTALLARTGLKPDDVDEVILGNCYPTMDAPAIGRVVALDAGLAVTTAGIQLDRRCGSGLQAIIDAACRVALGVADVVIAGGVESMSRAPLYTTELRNGWRGDSVRLDDALAKGRVSAGGINYPVPGGMLETAENVRRDHQISRCEQDELALRSHERAVAAMREGRFESQIVPVAVPKQRVDAVIEVDEQPREDTSVEALSALSPVMRSTDPDATVTAGNASSQNDGAALCVVTTRAGADARRLTPVARLVAWGLAGVPPRLMGIGPVPAVEKALGRACLRMSDMDLIEINEAFAAQVLACTKMWGFHGLESSDWDRINVNGSGISLGHPVGATGARIMATMLHELDRRRGRYALETMCIGSGQGLAAIFERCAA